MASLWLAFWLAQSVLEIQGDSTCPTPAQVSQHLTSLTGREARSSEQAPHAILSAREGSVGIELLAPDGSFLAERQLARTASCAELAEAAAVILAAWQTRFDPRLAPIAVDPEGPAPAATPAGRRQDVGAPRPARFDVGVGLLTSIAEGDAVVGARLQAATFPFALPVGLEAALSVTAPHTKSTTLAEARWSRSALSLGGALRIGRQSVLLDLYASGLLGLLRVQGAALADPASDTTVKVGVAAGARGLWAGKRGAAWVGADLHAYPGHDRLTVDKGGFVEEVGWLPRLEVQLTLGFSLGRFR